MKVCQVRWSTIGVALVVVLFARDAGAQGSPILPETRSIRVGPMSLYPTFALREVGSDSNVYLEPESPKADFTYTLAPKLHVVLPLANTRFVGTALGDFVHFTTYKDQQSIDGSLDGRYEFVHAGVRPFASVGIARRQERRGFDIDARIRQAQTMMSGGVDIDLTAVTALTASISRVSSAWDTNEQYRGVLLAEQLDSTTHTLSGGAKFHVTPLTRIAATVEIQRSRFARSPLRDADGVRLGPSVDFDTSASITGRAQAGYRSFVPLNPALAAYRGFAGAVHLRYIFRNITVLTVEGNRDVDYSYDVIHPYYLESGGRVRISQRLIGPFEAIGVVERHDLQYQRLGESTFNGRREITRGVGGGVALQIRKQVRVEAVFEKTARTSSDPTGRDYERRRIVGSVIYGV